MVFFFESTVSSVKYRACRYDISSFSANVFFGQLTKIYFKVSFIFCARFASSPLVNR